jgi:hypothetical protein
LVLSASSGSRYDIVPHGSARYSTPEIITRHLSCSCVRPVYFSVWSKSLRGMRILSLAFGVLWFRGVCWELDLEICFTVSTRSTNHGYEVIAISFLGIGTLYVWFSILSPRLKGSSDFANSNFQFRHFVSPFLIWCFRLVFFYCTYCQFWSKSYWRVWRSIACRFSGVQV